MIKIGTRGSKLALWQAGFVANKLGRENCEIIIIKTKGDKIQNVSFDKIEGKGFFTKEIEAALLNNKIDLAVHSMKDLPVEITSGLKISAVCKRENPLDILIINKDKYHQQAKYGLADRLVVGTSSLRRAAQLKCIKQNIILKALRGNVTTRIKKLAAGEFDAIILAKAGVLRLGLDMSEFMVIDLPVSQFLPAPAQGALALQIRAGDVKLDKQLAKINHQKTFREVLAERLFLQAFGGGCQIPLGAFAELNNEDMIILQGAITSQDGLKQFKDQVSGVSEEKIAAELAERLKNMGAQEFL
jgi:hydroxymethylbilane synthase